MSSIDFGLPQVVRIVGHVAAWARYHVTGAPKPSEPPARFTYHGSPGGPARVDSDCG